MSEFPIERLYALMSDVFMLRDFPLKPSMTAEDVPGWDSLHHTILMMELERVTGVELSPQETARLPNIGALHRAVLEKLHRP
jgi:acyl carrier protein